MPFLRPSNHLAGFSNTTVRPGDGYTHVVCEDVQTLAAPFGHFKPPGRVQQPNRLLNHPPQLPSQSIPHLECCALPQQLLRQARVG